MINRNTYLLIKRKIKFLYQRLTRGWSDDETWNLDYTIAKFALPRLKRFKELHSGYPNGMTEEEWGLIIDKMIKSLELIIEDMETVGVLKNVFGDELYDAIRKKDEEILEGLDLFFKYFRHLWL